MNRKQRPNSGAFRPGHNRPGPGRPSRAIEAAYLNVAKSACTLEEWGKVVARAVADAIKGDHRARSWLGDYLIGSPANHYRRPVAEPPDFAGIAAALERATANAQMGASAPEIQREPDPQTGRNRSAENEGK